MTQTGYTNMIVNTMLGWLKTVASWVLRFFNLYGGKSPLEFLTKNWLKLLVILLVAGVILDLIVWIFRWRPHWVWFGKKRVVINDKNFFVGEEYADNDVDGETAGKNVCPRKNWVDNDFVVKSRHKKPRAHVDARTDARQTDVFSDESFNVDAKHRFADRYEDEVFNVEDLPDGTDAQPEKREENGEKKKVRGKTDKRVKKNSGSVRSSKGGKKK